MQKKTPELVRRIFATFLCILLWASAQAADTGKGLLWEIQKDGTTAGYLFGTIHSDDPRVIKLPETVQQRFDQTKSLALEMDLNIANTITVAQSMFFNDGRKLSGLLEKDLFEAVAAILAKHKIPAHLSAYIKPWAAFLMLNMPPVENASDYMDLLLYRMGGAQKKKIYGLETAQEQIGIMEDFSLEEQVQLLRDTVAQLKQQDVNQIFEQLHALYLARDLDGMVKLNDDLMREQPSELADRLIYSLIEKRNLRMLERMLPRLAEGNAFIAVGALHLPGAHGLLELLRGQGYTVSPLY